MACRRSKPLAACAGSRAPSGRAPKHRQTNPPWRRLRVARCQELSQRQRAQGSSRAHCYSSSVCDRGSRPRRLSPKRQRESSPRRRWSSKSHGKAYDPAGSHGVSILPAGSLGDASSRCSRLWAAQIGYSPAPRRRAKADTPCHNLDGFVGCRAGLRRFNCPNWDSEFLRVLAWLPQRTASL